MADGDPEQKREDAFLVEDFKHWGESYFRNEASGDTRLSFFVGVIASVFAALGVIASVNQRFDLGQVRDIGTAATLGLLAIGFLTLLRILRRNRVTDGYLHALNRIREHFVRDEALLRDYLKKVPRTRARLASFGGIAHVVAAVNAALVFVAFWIAAGGRLGAAIVFVVGAIAAVIGFLLQEALIQRSEAAQGPAEVFRASVGLLVMSHAGKVLLMERSDVPEPAWQLPQGGIEAGERVEDAAWRELHEETGLGREHVGECKVGHRWLAYELPAGYRKAKTGRGQVQKWVLFRLRENVGEPDLTPGSARSEEARAFRWASWQQVLERAAPFRRDAYEELPSEFPGLPRGSRLSPP